MYNDNEGRFSIRNVVFQFLFVALFIFILIWLFPLKSDIQKWTTNSGNSSNSIVDLSMFYDQIFNNNVIAMKDAAKSYYTDERLPKNVGDKVSMTLSEMLEAKIILPFVDSKGKTCDLMDSYVEVTKESNEYVLKVNLKCSEQENYLLVYMGCYTYCTTPICEKNQTDVKKPVIYDSKTKTEVKEVAKKVVNNITNITNNITNVTNNITNNNTTNNITNNNTTNNNVDIDINITDGGKVPPKDPDPDPEPKPPEKKDYEYEYIKKTGGHYSEWGEWSNWASTYPTPSDLIEVKYRTLRRKILTGYNVVTKNNLDKPIWGTKKVAIAALDKTVCKTYKKITTTSGGGSSTLGGWKYVGIYPFDHVPTNSDYVKYEYVSSKTERDDICSKNACGTGRDLLYRKYERVVGSSGSVSTSTEYQCIETEKVRELTIIDQPIITGYETYTEKEPVYDYEYDKQYSYRKRTWVDATVVDRVWSTYNNTSLLNNGYKYTGNYRQK